MFTDNAVDGSETDPGAFEILGAMQPLENAEQLIRVLHIEANAVIAHEHGGIAIHFKVADLNHRTRPRPRVFDGIGKKVGENLFHQAGVAKDGWEGMNPPVNRASFGFAFEINQDIIDQRSKLGGLPFQFLAPHSGKVQQIVDQPAHVSAAIANIIEVTFGFSRQLSSEILEYDFGEGI